MKKDTSITFLGAAGEVTGSCHLLETAAGHRVLLDCGMHQGGDAVDRMQDEEFAFDPSSIDALILSHAHLDHSGLLPLLVHRGFDGPIYCTRATVELLEIMLHDSAGLYLRDLERENLRRARRGRKPEDPVYDQRDVLQVLQQCEGIRYRTPTPIFADLELQFHDAGHILGSAIVELTVDKGKGQRTLVFSGDLGRSGAVLMKDPARLQHADVVMMESTYGNRDHRCEADTIDQLRDILHETWRRGGSVMIPSFAVGRTQEILFHLGALNHAGDLDPWQVFLDSPMAIAVTRVYDRWLQALDSEDVKLLSDAHRESLVRFLPTLQLTEDTDQSMAINRIKGGAIIIAGSGMCTGGRIRHHFKQRIWDDRNTVIFVGFQARGTLGRVLVDGAREIKMFGDPFVVKARIESLGCFSAHAGQSELLDWASAFKPAPQMVLVHGEPEAQVELAQKLYEEHGLSVEVPARGDSLSF